MPLTAPPTAPSTADPSTFSARMDATLAWMATLVTEANALETNVNAKEVATNADAIATAADRVQTGLDTADTAADAIATAADRIQTGLDRAAAEAAASTAGGAAAFLDTNPIVKGSADATKQVRFEVDGLTTGTTRVLTVPDENMTLAGRGGNTFTGGQNELKGPDIASAATAMDIWATAQGNKMTVTGTTATSGLPAAPQAGASRELIAAGAWPLTNGANFIVPGGDHTCEAGDIVEVTALTTTQFRLKITKADGTPVVSGAASGLVWLASATASNQAVVDFVSKITAAHDNYLLVIDGAVPAVAGYFQLQTSSNNGVSFDAGGSDYSWVDSSSTNAYTNTANGASTDSSIAINAASISTTTSVGGLNGEVELFGLNSTTKNKMVRAVTDSYTTSTNAVLVSNAGGMRLSTAAINAIRIKNSAGNILSGTFTLFGYAI
jgi:hypothetical protein